MASELQNPYFNSENSKAEAEFQLQQFFDSDSTVWRSKGRRVYLTPQNVYPNFRVFSWVNIILAFVVATVVSGVIGHATGLANLSFLLSFPALYLIQRSRFENTKVLFKGKYASNTIKPSNVSYNTMQLNIAKNAQDKTAYYKMLKEMSFATTLQPAPFGYKLLNNDLTTTSMGFVPDNNMKQMLSNLMNNTQSTALESTTSSNDTLESLHHNLRMSAGLIDNNVESPMNVKSSMNLEKDEEDDNDDLNEDLIAENPDFSRLVDLWDMSDSLNESQLERVEACYDNLEESLELLEQARKQKTELHLFIPELPEQKMFDDLSKTVLVIVDQIYAEIREERLAKIETAHKYIKTRFVDENQLSL